MNIELPNGKIAEFPENLSHDEIKSIIAKKFPKPGLLSKTANYAEKYINQPIEKHFLAPMEDLFRSAAHLGGGFIQGLANIVPGLTNLGVSGINSLGGNLPKANMIDVIPHGASTSTGELASFFAGPGLIKGLGKLSSLEPAVQSAMKIPIIAQGIKHATNIFSKSPGATRTAGNSILGGTYTPENPLAGMALGATGGLLGEAASKGYNGIKNSLTENQFLQKNLAKIQPEKQAKDLENYLSGGTNNVTENSKALVKDIRNAYENRNAESKIYYDYALDKAGNQKIYKNNQFILNQPDESLPTLNKIKDLNVGDLYHIFKSNPTFNNAHKLQSELGSLGRKLESNPSKTQDDIHQISKIKSAQKQLQSDITNFLERFDKTSNNTIGDKYKKASELFNENVVPYLENNKILDITRGGKTDIKDLHAAFNTPTNKINKNGIEEIGHINKIMQDLPETAKRRILFDAIGGNKLSPEALLKKLEEIKSTGFGSYFTPEIEESINALTKKIKNKKNLKIGAGIVGAGATTGATMNALSHLF
jgi:hypothetical protein